MICFLQSKGVTDKEKNKIEEIYFHHCEFIIRASSSGLWLTDSINLNFLIESLKTESKYTAINAYVFLYQRSDINILKNYRKKIKQALSQLTLSFARKVHLLALASNTGELIEDTSALEKEVKKYLLDTISENEMIANLDTNQNYNIKSASVNELRLKGNRRCLQALIVHFNEPSFNWIQINKFAPQCTTNTLRIPIIEGLSRYYSTVPLLNDSLYLLMHSDKFLNRDYVSSYFSNFLQWAKKEFGVVPKDLPLPYSKELNFLFLFISKKIKYQFDGTSTGIKLLFFVSPIYR